MGQIAGPAEVQTNLKYVNAFQDRFGAWHYYFRRRGVRTPLPGQPGTVEFLAVYTKLLDPPAKPTVDDLDPNRTIEPGSFEALCRAFKGSADFIQLSPDWQREMGYVIKVLIAEHGHKPVQRLGKRHIIEMKNALKHKPGACNKMLRVIRQVLEYGVTTEELESNPAEKVKLMKGGRFRAWTDKEMSLFEKHWKLGTVERFIYDTGLYSGQRANDLSKLMRSAIILGAKIKLVQKKTGKPMTLRIHSKWKASMDAYLPTHNAKTLIAGRKGESIQRAAMADIFREAKRAAGLPEACVLHGLRKTTARILAEHGQKSAPVTGHLTRAMQDEYERDANQEKMASAAILKWDAKRKRT